MTRPTVASVLRGALSRCRAVASRLDGSSLNGRRVWSWTVASGKPRFAVPHEFGVGRFAHQLDQFIAVAEVHRARPYMGLSVGRAVPIEVVAPWSPTGALVLTDRDFEVLGAIGSLNIAVGAAHRQLPADVRLGRDDAEPAIERQLVQRASSPAFEPWPIEEDARIVDDPCLSSTVIVLLGHLVGPVVLPLLRCELFGPLLDALLVVLVREVRTQRAAAIVGSVGIDALASRPEDAGPVAGQPCEVATEYLVGIDGVAELHPRARKVEVHFWHGVSVRPHQAGSVIGMEVGAVSGVRLGVLDVGSNTVHLLVVDAHHGAAPRSAYTYKNELRLAEFLADDGGIAPEGVEALAEFVGEAAILAEQVGAEEMLAFATSAIREAPNGDAVITTVSNRTGVDLEVLSGADEARLTFLAVRRWFGWSSGRLLVLDIGGGSLEVAVGNTEEPDAAFSLPLGAGRLTREFLKDDPPSSADVKHLRKHVRHLISDQAPVLASAADASHVVGTSKTFRQLARLSGAAPSSAGPHVPRLLRRDRLSEWVPKIARMTARERSELPGVSVGRAPQLLAGALVAESVMDAVDAETIQICPWALREGVILRRLDWMDG